MGLVEDAEPPGRREQLTAVADLGRELLGPGGSLADLRVALGSRGSPVVPRDGQKQARLSENPRISGGFASSGGPATRSHA